MIVPEHLVPGNYSAVDLISFPESLDIEIDFLYNSFMNKEKLASEAITFRPITDKDLEFLLKVYASTRAEEMAMSGWNAQEIDNFLRMQFNLQHTQYMDNYKKAAFDIILFHEVPAGRLYVKRYKNDIRIIDIALLTQFRRQKIGSKIMQTLIDESHRKNMTLSLHVEQNNPAMGLYEQLGFEKKELKGIYYFMERPPGTNKPG